MKVTWTAKPRTRLAELYDYIAQDSKPRALAMAERLLDRSETLEYAPRSGTRLSAFVDDEMREMILKREAANRLKKYAIDHGMRTLRDDGWDRVRLGVTTAEEVLRITKSDRY